MADERTGREGIDCLVRENTDLRAALDAANVALDLRCAQLLMVASQLGRDPKIGHDERSDPRWTPALHEAWCAVQKHKEDAAQIVELMQARDAALTRCAELEAQRDALRIRHCKNEAGMEGQPETARGVCLQEWPDQADVLFPTEGGVKPCLGPRTEKEVGK
jgi:hypothetical protein